jgi:hypothetical protein
MPALARTLEHALQDALRPALGAAEFALVRSRSAFERNEGWRIVGFRPSANPNWPGVRIALWLPVRVPAVEEIFHRFSGYERRYQRGTYTVGAYLGEWLGDEKAYTWELRELDEVDAVAAQIGACVEQAAGYYASLADLGAVAAALNDARPMYFELSSRALIAARLAGRDDFDALVARHREHLARHHGFFLDRVDALLAHLRASPAAQRR